MKRKWYDGRSGQREGWEDHAPHVVSDCVSMEDSGGAMHRWAGRYTRDESTLAFNQTRTRSPWRCEVWEDHEPHAPQGSMTPQDGGEPTPPHILPTRGGISICVQSDAGP